MKNLKKVLALVLVVATLMGFATVASAADFTDAKSIEHKEAVDVMKMIGVINGLPNGSFNPNGTLDRAQMATMVALIINKGESVSKTYAGANSFTDCVGHWASGAIALASSQGIISGVGNGKFNPDGPVTGAQASRMLVSALGYDTKSEGIGGAQWATKAVSVAKRAGLLDGLDGMNVNAVLTRDQACQMMFNALKADMVEYDSKGGTIDLGDVGSINFGGSTAKAVAQTASKDYAKDNGPTPTSTGKSQQLCEEYFPGLTLNNDVAEDENLGVTGNSWTYKKDSVGPYAAEAEITYTAKVKQADVEKDLKNYSNPDAAITAKIANKNTTTGGTDGTGKATGMDTKAKVAEGVEFLSGNGNVVKIYVDSADKITNVVAIQPAVGEVTVRDYKATSSKGARTNYAITGTKSGDVFTTIVDEDADKDTAVVTGDVQDKDLVTYYRDGNNKLHIFATTEVTGVITSVNKSGEATMDGTKYKAHATYGDTIDASKDERTITLDQYGYIIADEYSSSETLYGMILDKADYSTLEDGKVKTTKAVLIATADGKVETIDINGVKDTAEGTLEDYDEATDQGAIVTYKLRKGKYDLTKASTGKNVSTLTKVEKEETALSVNVGQVTKASSKTIYVIANFDEGKPDGTVTTYTGYKNVPAYKKDGNLAHAYAVNTGDNGGAIADVVFVMDDVAASSKNEWVYLTGDYTSDVDGYHYVAAIDGKFTTVTADEKAASTYETAALYSSLNVTNGVLTGTKAAATLNEILVPASIKGEGEFLDVAGTLTEVKDGDVKVYEIAKDAETDNDITVTAAVEWDGDVATEDDEHNTLAEIYVALDDSKVTAVYILYVA